MSEDRLRRFVKDNLSELDDKKAPSRVWERIERDLDESKIQKTFSIKQLGLIIAAVLILFSTGIYFGSSFMNKSQPEQHFAGIQDLEYQELEHYYKPLLQNKEQHFVSQVNEQSVLEELNALDKGFEELKSDFMSNSNNKELMMYLMKENYELRIKILEIAMEKMTTKSPDSKKNKNYEIKQY